MATCGQLAQQALGWVDKHGDERYLSLEEGRVLMLCLLTSGRAHEVCKVHLAQQGSLEDG